MPGRFEDLARAGTRHRALQVVYGPAPPADGDSAVSAGSGEAFLDPDRLVPLGHPL